MGEEALQRVGGWEDLSEDPRGKGFVATYGYTSLGSNAPSVVGGAVGDVVRKDAAEPRGPVARWGGLSFSCDEEGG